MIFSGLSQNLGPLGLLRKILLESKRWASTKYYLRWKAEALKPSHTIFRLARSGAIRNAGEFGFWPTPKATDSFRAKFTLAQVRKTLLRRIAGELSSPNFLEAFFDSQERFPAPEFIEWLMGFPPQWTRLDTICSATPSSRKSHTKSSAPSRKSRGDRL